MTKWKHKLEIVHEQFSDLFRQESVYDLRRACDTVTLVVGGHFVDYSLISEDFAMIAKNGVHMPKTGQFRPSP